VLDLIRLSRVVHPNPDVHQLNPVSCLHGNPQKDRNHTNQSAVNNLFVIP